MTFSIQQRPNFASMLATSDFAVPKASPMSMSYDTFHQPRQMSVDFNAASYDRSPVRGEPGGKSP